MTIKMRQVQIMYYTIWELRCDDNSSGASQVVERGGTVKTLSFHQVALREVIQVPAQSGSSVHHRLQRRGDEASSRGHGKAAHVCALSDLAAGISVHHHVADYDASQRWSHASWKKSRRSSGAGVSVIKKKARVTRASVSTGREGAARASCGGGGDMVMPGPGGKKTNFPPPMTTT
jgi:hypothetical protein